MTKIYRFKLEKKNVKKKTFLFPRILNNDSNEVKLVLMKSTLVPKLPEIFAMRLTLNETFT